MSRTTLGFQATLGLALLLDFGNPRMAAASDQPASAAQTPAAAGDTSAAGSQLHPAAVVRGQPIVKTLEI